MTRLDAILAGVRYGESEVTIDTEGYTPDQVSKIIEIAKSKGFTPSYDGRFILVRDMVPPR